MVTAKVNAAGTSRRSSVRPTQVGPRDDPGIAECGDVGALRPCKSPRQVANAAGAAGDRLAFNACGRELVGLTAAAFAAAIAVSAAGPSVASAAKVERVSTLGQGRRSSRSSTRRRSRGRSLTPRRKRVAKLTLQDAGGDRRPRARARAHRASTDKDMAAGAAARASERHDRLGARPHALRACSRSPRGCGSTRRRSGSRSSRTARRSSARGSASGSRNGRRHAGSSSSAPSSSVSAARGRSTALLAFITSATSPTLTDWPGGGIVGVHGTNTPGLIPGRISHGCVRLRNADILKLGEADAGRHPAHHHLMPCDGRKRLAGSYVALDPASWVRLRRSSCAGRSSGRGRRSWRTRPSRGERSACVALFTRSRAIGMFA